MVACLIVVVWAATGPLFDYSDTWQLVINTGTTIVTFLMVFLIQNTQNRDSLAIHLKLDELIRAVGHARNKLIDLEELNDEELASLQEEFRVARRNPGHTPTVFEHNVEKEHHARTKRRKEKGSTSTPK
jgi:low affinity Fe/Cu permease